MKTTLIALTLAAAGLAATPAMAEPGNWMVRGRAVQIDPADKSDAGGPLALRADAITVSDKTIPEIDFTYFFSPHFSAELVLTVPQKHTVAVNGTAIGTFKHLPPTLTAQYRFAPGAAVDPYVGAGLNYTRIGSVHLLDNTADLENHSFGLALQAGVDIRIDERWSFNVDVKKVQIRSDVTAGGARVSGVRVDPWLIGAGFGYRF